MNFPKDKVIPRYSAIAVVMTLIGILIIGKATYIMTVKKPYWMAVAERFRKENKVLRPTRGDILSDDGELLAASIPEYKMYFDFMSSEKDSARRIKDQFRRDTLLQNHIDEICQGLHKIFPDVEPAEMKKHLAEGREKQRMNWPVLKRRVSYIEYRRVKQLPVFCKPDYYGGFHVEKFETRKNPYGNLAIRTVGDLYKGKDSARSGLELYFDKTLRGVPGRYHRQKVLDHYLSIVDQPAQNGYDVQTTLNVQMQDICETALRDQLKHIKAQNNGKVHFGVCILMEVATGDVKAISSLTQLGDGSFMEIQNKAVSNLMEPGSVFKPMSFLVAFNDGYLHLNDPVYVGGGVVDMYGRKMKDHNWRSGGYGSMVARQCIQYSSNVGVSYFIDKFYRNQPEKFVDGIMNTGVGDDLHLPIPGYAKPRIIGPRQKGEYWAKTDLPWMSIGYVTQIPPISTLAFYNGIANNGKMMRPRFVKAILNNGEPVQTFEPIVQREHMAKEEAVRDVQTCLREVVTLGVGKKAASKLVSIAGKTGTAQVWTSNGRTTAYLVSFAGFFPFENPKYSMIVCVNKDGAAGGAIDCCPVFKRVAESIMALDRKSDYRTARDTNNIASPVVCSGDIVAAQHVLDELNVRVNNSLAKENESVVWGTSNTQHDGVALDRTVTASNTVPDLRGYGLRDALFRLEQMGLKVRVVGVGRVTGQSLLPGYIFKKGETISLTLGDGKANVEQTDSIRKIEEQRAQKEQSGQDSVQRSTQAEQTLSTTSSVKKTVTTTEKPAPSTPKKEQSNKKNQKEAIAKPKEKNQPDRSSKDKNKKDKPKEPALKPKGNTAKTKEQTTKPKAKTTQSKETTTKSKNSTTSSSKDKKTTDKKKK